MEFLQLLKTVTGQKEFKMENAYFPGEKIESLLKLLKKHVVKIDVQASFLNAGNCPDLVIEYNGPSTGRAIFHGEMFSSGEKKLQAQEKREAEKRAQREEKLAEKARKNESQRILKMSREKRFKAFKFNPTYRKRSTINDTCYVDLERKEVIHSAVSHHGLTWHVAELSALPIDGRLYFFEHGGPHDGYCILI